MGTVPEAYHPFITRYAPYFYVIATAMNQDSPAGQKNVPVADGSKFQVGYPVEIKDDAHTEWNKVASISGNVLTMENNLAYTYNATKNGRVEGPDPAYGRGVLASAFAIDFLHEAYNAKQFEANKTETLAKITELADFILTQQCTDDTKKAYGGFRNSETGTEYWSIDAGRCIPPLLKAYTLTNTASYLNAAKLAGSTFLYNMQHKPSELGVHDKYYGAFARYVTTADAWSQPMNVEDLYDLIGLKMLAETYDTANKNQYETMMSDAIGFLRDGFEQLYLWFDPKPSGDGKWHRVGLNETEVYDDPMSFALLGLYAYEGWSVTCQRVYSSLQGIRPSAQYPAYYPAVCWPGYMDVVTRSPACPYYDAITSGILSKMRAAHDKPSLAFSVKIVDKYQSQFMYWGPKFDDFTPITEQKAMANVSWLAQLFLCYEEPITAFTRILRSKGENILLYQVTQVGDRVTYSERTPILAIVDPTRADEILIEPGYIVNDYITLYTFAPLRRQDKIRHKGEDYEILSVQAFDFAGEPAYFRVSCRRLIG